MNRPTRHVLATAALLLAIACIGAQADSPQKIPAAAPVAASIASTARLEGDRDEDIWRRPAAVLVFLEAKPGQQVIDYFAGGGYYTELLS